jgi:exosortase A-associated hydrolase 2
MNLSRRTAAIQAHALSGAGVAVLLLDLFGTGDSEGEFIDARWELWIEDVVAAADWLKASGCSRVGLWGLRLGGLLAATVAARWPDRFRRLLLWQPSIDGKTMLTQFLRIRVAASMGNANLGETADRLRRELVEKRRLEVAGYELSAELGESLDEARLDTLALNGSAHVDWFQVAANAEDRLPIGPERILGAWRMRGISLSAASVVGEPFWAVPEAPTATELVAATTRSVIACPLW